jgi:D-alanyl-D-alanine carboxypeptidase
MKIVKQFLLILAALGLMLASYTTMARHAALLIDAENGDVLYELEANQAWYPASLTKLMTLYMAFSALESGRLRLNDRMSVSSHAAHQPTSKLGLRPWDSISVEDAILAVVTRSANDAAVVLGERIAGTESQFAIQMTTKAHSLGMYGSHFMNATGLPHDWQTTTAHDMAVLALRIMRDFPQYYPYFRADSLYFNGRYMRSTNKFVAHYPGAEGMKTGYTCGAGYNLVATANQFGKRLIGVVLGGKSSSERYEHMFTMMDIGFGDEYGSYHPKNINTMSKNSFGAPPYQLSCGHRPSTHFAAHHTEDVEDEDHHVRYVRKVSHTTRHIAEKSRPVMIPREITRVKIAGKTKAIVRHFPEPLHTAKASKTSRENVKAEKKRNLKMVVPLAKSKLSKKPGKPIQTAKVSKPVKGYYVPGGNDKKDSAPKSSKSSASNKNKKPEVSNKVVAKSASKSKKSAKKKS